MIRVGTFRKNAGRTWTILVWVDYGPECTVADLLAGHREFRALGEAFRAAFTVGNTVGRYDGNHETLWDDRFSIHTRLWYERREWNPKKTAPFDESDHEKIVTFFHEHGIDLVPYR